MKNEKKWCKGDWTTPSCDKKYDRLSIVFWLENKMRLTVKSSNELTMNCSNLFWLVNKLFLTVQSSDMTCSDLWTSCGLLYSTLMNWQQLVLTCEQTKTYCTFLWYDLFWLVNKLWLTVQSSDELAMMLSLNGLNLISSTTPACPHTWGVFGSTRPLYKIRVQSSITEISIS